jgi:putative transposase
MKTDITSTTATTPSPEIFTGDDWVDPLETEIRGRIRGFIEALAEQELQQLLSRGHYTRRPAGAAGTGIAGHRHGRRNRTLRGTFGEVTVELPRARLVNPDRNRADTAFADPG